MSMTRVSRRQPCPICGRPDWCLRAADGSAAICQRVVPPHDAPDARAWAQKNREDLTKTTTAKIESIKQRSNGGTNA